MAERWYAGVDGCRAGWFVILLGYRGAQLVALRHRLCTGFDAVPALAERPARIAVDMPIGLLAAAQPGGRSCDRAARRCLGQRRASVFSPPARPVLGARTYPEALRLSRAGSDAGLGLSRQAFNLLPKLRELDACLSPARQGYIVEAHPELAFLHLAGSPMRHNKKRAEGRAERLALLERALGRWLPELEAVRRDYGAQRLAPDDSIDACVLAWVARQLDLGQARRLPEGAVEQDGKGLRMEIWY
ncbi:MAG: DUF429 domain-containing protein [Pseudomonadota bacterium]